MTPDRALLIAHARLLGATYRRIAELFGGSTQADGERLCSEAEAALGLPAGMLDRDDVGVWADWVHEQMGERASMERVRRIHERLMAAQAKKALYDLRQAYADQGAKLAEAFQALADGPARGGRDGR